MKDRYELIVFDWDGTLSDSVGWIVTCLQQAARETGLTPPDDRAARSIIGLSLQGAMDLLYPGAPETTAQQLLTHYRRAYYDRSGQPIPLFAGVDAMLSTFRERGYQLAVATGKARSGFDRALDESGTRSVFHATRCADETASKPHPRMVDELLAELAVPRHRALLVGDSLHDLLMARNAGVDAIAVSCGANTAEELAELSPLACLESAADLLNLFFGQETL